MAVIDRIEAAIAGAEADASAAGHTGSALLARMVHAAIEAYHTVEREAAAALAAAEKAKEPPLVPEPAPESPPPSVPVGQYADRVPEDAYPINEPHEDHP